MKKQKIYSYFGNSEIIILRCDECGEEYEKYKILDTPNKVGKKFCDKKCWYSWKSKNIPSWNKGTKGLTKGNSGSFKKGLVPWNFRMYGFRGGSQSHFWKGGILKLTTSIRISQRSKIWKRAILERDKFSCVECGATHTKYHVDHIKRFTDIFKEFLQKYNQFSPIEDKETLLRLSQTHEPFWDLSNGRTLCIPCHKKTETYLNKKK